MAGPGGILALDASLTTGWCYGGLRENTPEIGRWRINGGIHAMGETWVDLQNQLNSLAAVVRPALIVYAVPFAKMQTTARLLLGMSAHIESECYRLEIEVREVPESTARKAIIGRGSFGLRDQENRIIKGTASREAKAASVAWCRNKGWQVRDDNEADACVIWEYTRRFRLARKQWGEE